MADRHTPWTRKGATQYAGNARGKGTSQMKSDPQEKPRWRRSSVLVFAGFLALGLLMLAGRFAALPGLDFGQVVLPLLGGIGMAAALAVIVLRDRRERAELPPEERDRQDQGTPR